MKGSGKPDDRKGQVRFEVAGAGNGFMVRLVRHRQTKGTVTDRQHLRDTAPVLDPTLLSSLYGLTREEIAIIEESLQERAVSREVADDSAFEESQ